MKGNLFDPTAVMDSDNTCVDCASSSSPPCDFGFAFNDSNFSDRLLQIEIMEGPSECRSDGERSNSIADWARHRKRRRKDIKKDNGDEAVNRNDSNGSTDCSTILRVKSLHISSHILAANSPFFYKLFSNGMRESEQRHATLRINASEETAVMELLNFMYSNNLSSTAAPAVLDVLMATDKFDVASCMRYCSGLLLNLPMTPESALLYLDLPSGVLMAEAVLPLAEAAKQFLATHYRDMTECQQEVMKLPLAGIEAVLFSDDLQVDSEDAVYDFILKWTRASYPKLEERREILGTRLIGYIRFPFMTCEKLKKVLTCEDFDHEIALKFVLEALFFKAEAPHSQRTLAAQESIATTRRFIERAYEHRPVKVVEYKLPRQ